MAEHKVHVGSAFITHPLLERGRVFITLLWRMRYVSMCERRPCSQKASVERWLRYTVSTVVDFVVVVRTGFVRLLTQMTNRSSLGNDYLIVGVLSLSLFLSLSLSLYLSLSPRAPPVAIKAIINSVLLHPLAVSVLMTLTISKVMTVSKR